MGDRKAGNDRDRARTVGVATQPNQVHAEALLRPFDLTLMIVGACMVCVCLTIGRAGLGKSTFVNTLFKTDVYEKVGYPSAAERAATMAAAARLNVQRATMTMAESGVNVRLTIVDTAGLGSALDNEGW